MMLRFSYYKINDLIENFLFPMVFLSFRINSRSHCANKLFFFCLSSQQDVMNYEVRRDFYCVSIVCIISFSMCQSLEPIETKFCNENVTNHYIHNLELAIEPNPILIKRGEHVTIHLGFDLMKTFPPDPPFSNVVVETELFKYHEESNEWQKIDKCYLKVS